MQTDKQPRMPLARTDEVVVSELPDEILIYDKRRDKAHCLNSAAGMVWKLCDGRTSVGKMAERMSRELGTPVDEQIIWMALEELGRSHLLEERVKAPAATISRRELARRIGLAAAIALPVVTSMLVPPAAAA